MRRTIFSLALALLAGNALAAAESFTLEPSHTYPYWSVRHMGFSTMQGRFNTTSGTLTLDREAKTGAVSVTIDATSIDSGHQKRDEHLKGPDFFNVKEFPSITFVSTGVKFDGDKPVEVSGNLTLLGVTKPAVLKVESISCGNNPMRKVEYRCGFEASMQVKRSDFGMSYGVPAIGDEIKLAFEIEAIRN